ncbi:MAG TPA: hypothetical protein VIX37_11140 [Candidatus Sulfotelmatobacter sp.]
MPKKKLPSISLVPVARELTDDDLDVIVTLARKRADMVGEMRAALLAGDNELALRLARKVAGLEEAA